MDETELDSPESDAFQMTDASGLDVAALSADNEGFVDPSTKATSANETSKRESKRKLNNLQVKAYRAKKKSDPVAWAAYRQKGNDAQKRSKAKKMARASVVDDYLLI